ncbi:chemotaxis protein CheA [Acidimangrovimonas sediminis]|uniref:chemotaxis protein CheA n=1 Tax=Acidimangrovimonas sediminis TaxID=2056283 RepID=UPI000C80E47E|nr:chemotaxis protein CheA [Acidimangrovimonas sediminis]
MSGAPDIRTTFFQECDELLEALNDGLASVQEQVAGGPSDPEALHAIFRAVHSIKGGAGAFGLNALVRFAHAFETVLDLLRSGKIPATEDLVALLFRAGDMLTDHVTAAREGRENAGDPAVAALMAELAAVSGAPEAPAAAEDEGGEEDFGFVPMTLPFELEGPGAQRFHIAFAASRRLYANGHDPLILFEALSAIGTLEVAVSAARLPDLTTLDPEEGYLDWALTLETEQDRGAIEEVFEFVEGLAEIEIRCEDEDPPAGAEGIDAGPQIAPAPRDPATVAEGSADATPPPPAPARVAPDAPPVAPTAASAAPPASQSAPGAAQGASSAPPASATIRVDLERVDGLINAVGELVIHQAMIAQKLAEAGVAWNSDIGAGFDAFRNLTSEIQERVMAIRAQPIKPLFQRMARIVREAAAVSGKTAQLRTEGEATEVDKTVIERLAEPLTHILRNAVDHGLETSEKRVAAGKPASGVISLSATYRSGRVVIEVADDGAGINREKVRAIAIEKGLIDPAAELSEAEVDRLLFMPGFSTATEVSDLSGRGVGMDVVKRTIQAIGGRISINSTPGRGTVISISLPLTLAVLDGILIEVCGETMVVPITAVVETLRPGPKDIHAIGPDQRVVTVRDTVVPVVDLGQVFGLPGTCSQDILLLVETESRNRYALAVDAIKDQSQVVIKGLEGNYRHVAGISAATILGDGRIALIIDPEEAVAQAAPVSPVAAAVAASAPPSSQPAALTPAR